METRIQQQHTFVFTLNKAFRAGLAGMGGQAINVVCLMWVQTIMNYQYRYGGSFTATAKKLYADGGFLRFYRGFGPAIFLAPLSRFGDVAANELALVTLKDSGLPVAVQTATGSVAAASGRLVIMPIDAWKTTKQVEGEQGLRMLKAKFKRHPFAPWHGGLGAMTATWVGHYPWFMTNNYLRETLPAFDVLCGKQLRFAAIGFMSSVVSDTCSNSLRVLKTVRQTSAEKISYRQAAVDIIEKEGYMGLFGRGLKTRILAKGLQGAVFTVGWQTTLELMEKRRCADTEKL